MSTESINDYCNALPQPNTLRARQILENARKHRYLDRGLDKFDLMLLNEQNVRDAWDYFNAQSVEDQLILQMHSIIERALFHAGIGMRRRLNDSYWKANYQQRKLVHNRALNNGHYTWMDDEHREAMQSTLKGEAA